MLRLISNLTLRVSNYLTIESSYDLYNIVTNQTEGTPETD